MGTKNTSSLDVCVHTYIVFGFRKVPDPRVVFDTGADDEQQQGEKNDPRTDQPPFLAEVRQD